VNTYISTITGSVGIGVRKSDGELLAKINNSLDKFSKDGTLKKILAKWGLD
jgi:polar amino acid transport system substrate-binding protein